MGSILRTFSVQRIAIIGAGPSGLAAAKYLRAENAFSKIVIYEQQSEVGGVWNYTPNIAGKTIAPQTTPNGPLDEPIWPKGASVPLFSNPMYDHLNTNIPKDLMRFSDSSFLDNSLLFPSREDVQEYLVRYSQDVRGLISFSTQVQDVKPVLEDGTERWNLTSKSMVTNKEYTSQYDAVVVASGHYTVPFIPSVPGMEEFHATYPSVIIHSKSYRAPQPYKNKKVIVVGSGASGLDIGNQISQLCQKPLLNSLHTPSAFKLGEENKEQVGAIVEFLVQDRSVRFTDGRVEKNIDAIIYCTGFLYSYPFLKSVDPPVVVTGQRVLGTYKHLFSISHPTLAFTALPMGIIPFPLSEAQAAIMAKVWGNKVELPTAEEMEKWEQETLREMGDGKQFHAFGCPKDGRYINELHEWTKTSVDGFAKEPPYWATKEWGIREKYVEIRQKFVESDGKAKSLAELGFDFE
ncbi:Thiol-specific monooxygenase 4 [Phlyctema vagabunda]|uniref:Thiol-specific monooxygenase 4 n=1 Tax=Phlyctema vagabunda TaxID=108571 RepID=A0ABR4PHZ6_9HELO